MLNKSKNKPNKDLTGKRSGKKNLKNGSRS